MVLTILFVILFLIFITYIGYRFIYSIFECMEEEDKFKDYLLSKFNVISNSFKDKGRYGKGNKE